MVPIIISSDEVKKTLEGYRPSRVENVHTESARIADEMLEDALKNSDFKDVILMCGGAASGKTEFLSEYLGGFDGIIFDGTLSNPIGAQIKLSKIRKAKKKPRIYAILPNDLDRAFKAFLNRDRQFADIHFLRTHCGARRTLLWIAENKPEVPIVIFRNFYLEDRKMSFKKVEFFNKRSVVEFLQASQYTENDLDKMISA